MGATSKSSKAPPGKKKSEYPPPPGDRADIGDQSLFTCQSH